MIITAETIRDTLGAIKPRDLKMLPMQVKNAVESGEMTANVILEKGLLEGMAIVGAKFKKDEIFLPEVMFAAKTMKDCVEVIKPHLSATGNKCVGKAVIGTVEGDNHDIGKNIVKIMLESKGIEVFDLGTNVTPEKFLSCAVENGCKVICLSALLTSTMPVMERVVGLVRESGNDIKIMVGGAPVTKEFADSIGADCYAADAASAADEAEKLLVG